MKRSFRTLLPSALLALLLPLCCVFECALAAATQPNQIRFAWEGGRKYVYIKDLAAYYGLALKYTREGCEISSESCRVSFTFDKRFGSINGIVVSYLFPPFIRGGEPLLSEHDFFLVVDPVLRNKALPKQQVRVVMIDPGHGGTDNGAVGRLYKEKDLTLVMAQKLKAALLAKGYSVIMTRDSDKFPSLQDRVDLCRRVKPDLFVSIHCNAAYDRSIYGVETYAATPMGAPSTSDSKPGYNQSSGNAFDKSSYRLAYEVQRELVGATKSEDRGVKHARFFVIKNAACPAILVETGFLSNSQEEASLSRQDRQSAIVSGIVSAIVKYAAAAK